MDMQKDIDIKVDSKKLFGVYRQTKSMNYVRAIKCLVLTNSTYLMFMMYSG